MEGATRCCIGTLCRNPDGIVSKTWRRVRNEECEHPRLQRAARLRFQGGERFMHERHSFVFRNPGKYGGTDQRAHFVRQTRTDSE